MQYAEIKYNKGDILGFCLFIERIQKVGNKYKAKFKCACGNEFIYNVGDVKCGRRRYCSNDCEQKKKDAPFRRITHGFKRRGVQATPEYNSWISMKTRCYNPECEDYKDYGGRGILVCERWLGKDGFINFFADMGARSSNSHSLDRFPNTNGNYELSNCRWATDVQQVRNRRISLNIEYKGEIKHLMEWCDLLNIPYETIRSRLKRGVSVKDAFEAPRYTHLINDKTNAA